MAFEINIFAGVTGMSLTASLAINGEVVIADVALAETSTPGYYVGHVPEGTDRGVYTVFVFNGPDVVSIGELLWVGDRELDPLILDDLHLIHGLRSGVPLQVSRTNRSAGPINQTINESGENVMVSRS